MVPWSDDTSSLGWMVVSLGTVLYQDQGCGTSQKNIGKWCVPGYWQRRRAKPMSPRGLISRLPHLKRHMTTLSRTANSGGKEVRTSLSLAPYQAYNGLWWTPPPHALCSLPATGAF